MLRGLLEYLNHQVMATGKILILIIFIFLSRVINSYGQVLLEDKEGDVLLRNNFAPNSDLALIKINTGAQSLGFNYLSSTERKDANDYIINEFGIKARATEGLATVLKNNQFSPGVRLTYAFTNVRLLSSDTKSSFIDWGGFAVNYNIDNYNLFKRDTIFDSQFETKDFRGFDFFLNYNYLVTNGNSAINSKILFTIKIGYSQKNNYNELATVNVEDVSLIIDPITLMERQVIKTRSGKSGQFIESDTYPIILSITKLTPTDGGNYLVAKAIEDKAKEEVTTAKGNEVTAKENLSKAKAYLDEAKRSVSAAENKYIIAELIEKDVKASAVALDSIKQAKARVATGLVKVKDATEKVDAAANTVKSATAKVQEASMGLIAASDDQAAIKKLRIGYTAYFKNIASDRRPKQDLGIIFFLTKQVTSGVRTPVLGLNIQAEDPFGINNQDSSLQDRVSIGLTSIFSL